MRFFRFSLFVMALCIIIPCSAKYKSYYQVNNDTYVTTTPNAVLYELTDNSTATNIRELIDIKILKMKKIKKPQQLKVVRCTNTSKQQDFNAYIVEYKNKTWVLCDSNAQDNTLLKERSAKMLQYRKYLEGKYLNSNLQFDSLSFRVNNMKCQFDSLVTIYTNQCEDSLNYYKNLKPRLPQIRDSLVAVKKAQEQAKADRAYKDWYNALPVSTKKAANIISITEASLSSPNSAAGCDYNFHYKNKSKKTIKYLYWSGSVYNAVNDLVSCEIRNRFYFSGKDTGPVRYGESGGGCWDCIIYNYSADRLKLDDISITYMDGSSANIAATDIGRLLKEPSRDIYVYTFDITDQVITDTKCQNKINIWEERLNNVQKRNFEKGYYEKYFSDEIDAIYQMCSLLKSLDLKLQKIYLEERKKRQVVENARKIYENFDKFMNFKVYSQIHSYSNTYTPKNQSRTTHTKDKFVSFGLEGSLEGLKSFSTGWGLSMRIGRFNSMFNGTIGIKYQYTGYRKNLVSYSYDNDNSYYSSYVYSYANYGRNVNQLVFPIILNWNIARNNNYAFYLGAGYEFGVLLSDKYKFDYSFGDPFNEDDFYKYSDDDLLQLSIPSRSIIFQMGFAGKHWDWKAYYKIYANKSKFINGDSGAIGTAFTYYF